MYALIEIKGKQYKAEKGGLLKVDKFENEKGSPLELGNVMMVGGEGVLKVGTPFVDGVVVKTVVEDHGKNAKIIGFKYKKRKNYRRNWGHRQQFTLLKVEDITGV